MHMLPRTRSATLIRSGYSIGRRFLTRFTIFLWELQTIFRSVLGRCFGANMTSADLIDVQRPISMVSTQASSPVADDCFMREVRRLFLLRR